MVESVGYDSGNDERCHAIMVMVRGCSIVMTVVEGTGRQRWRVPIDGDEKRL